MQVKQLSSEDEVVKISQVMVELRPQYSLKELEKAIKEQRQQGYQVAYVILKSEILAVAGFWLGNKLAWGKHIYVDDLVTTDKSRSIGAGKLLIDWLKDFGRRHECQELHLDSGVQRFGAHRFYLREGFIINSHHFMYPFLPGNE